MAAGPDGATRAAPAAAAANPSSSTTVVTAVPTRPSRSTAISTEVASVVIAPPAAPVSWRSHHAVTCASPSQNPSARSASAVRSSRI